MVMRGVQDRQHLLATSLNTLALCNLMQALLYIGIGLHFLIFKREISPFFLLIMKIFAEFSLAHDLVPNFREFVIMKRDEQALVAFLLLELSSGLWSLCVRVILFQ